MCKVSDIINKTLTKALNIIIGVFGSILVVLLVQLFCFTSFKIPSNSMEPALKDGDRIVVNKLIKGARLFDVFSALENKEVAIHQMPGWGSIKRNDILVFNFPYSKSRWDSIRMDVMQYYVKRCIALPGDTVEIRNGFYKIRGCGERLGNYDAQKHISELPNLKEYGIVERTFPYDKHLGWSVREFGPLAIPKRNQMVKMNPDNYSLYRQLINWEQKKKLRIKNGLVLLGDSLISQYRFEKNYYFVSGDNMPNSQDSRYWGMLPEEYIVGIATRIWYSEDRYTGKTRWNRVMKKID